jgi:hypothetical protein
VEEGPDGAQLELFGGGRLAVSAHVEVPAQTAAGWRYADPGAGEHDVVNCSIAALSVEVSRRGEGGRRLLHTEHGGAYELGMRERDHGVPLAPFADG